MASREQLFTCRGGKAQNLAGEQQSGIRSPHLDPHKIDDLYDAALAQGFHTKTLVLTGSMRDSRLPPEFYRRLPKGHNGGHHPCDTLACGREFGDCAERRRF